MGAVEENRRVDETGAVRTVLLVNDLSPSQREGDDRRERWHQEQRAKLWAEGIPDRAPTTAKGFVYVIAQAGTSRVKIGYARDETSRPKNLQTSNPYKLEVLWHTRGDRTLEGCLHVGVSWPAIVSVQRAVTWGMHARGTRTRPVAHARVVLLMCWHISAWAAASCAAAVPLQGREFDSSDATAQPGSARPKAPCRHSR